MSTPKTSPASSPDEFISAKDVVRMTGVHRRRVLQWASLGLITTRSLPGCTPKYLRRDVEAILADSIKPANRAG